MVACAPIPVLDVFCETLGVIAEVGFQSVAALEGAKAAIESMSAVTAHRKEQAEIALAIAKHEEAAASTLQAEEIQGFAEEKLSQAALESHESVEAAAESEEVSLLGEKKLKDSQEEEAMALLDEEKSAEYAARAARDESLAVEDEATGLAELAESKELTAKSMTEEIESIAERTDAEAKGTKSERLLKKSLGHAMSAMAMAVNAFITAGLVAYIMTMRVFMKVIVPSAGRAFRGESTFNLRVTAAAALDLTTKIALHLFAVALSISALGDSLIKFDGMHRFAKAKSILHLSLIGGTIESAAISLLAACGRRKSIGFDLLASWIYLVPRVLLEILVVVAVCGQGVFSTVMPYVNQMWLGCLVVFVLMMYARKAKQTKPVSSIQFEEDSFCGVERQRIAAVVDVSEYGSLEEVSLLTSESSNKSNKSNLHKETISTQLPWQIRRSFGDYLAGLKLWSDLLVITLVVIIFLHSGPILEILQPVSKTALGAISSVVSFPVLAAAGLMGLIVVHFVFVR